MCSPFYLPKFEIMDREFKVKSWEELSKDEFHACLRLRVDVFVVEQNCPYPDLDTKDQKSLHVFLEAESKISLMVTIQTAYLRICKARSYYKEPSIGRVVTSGGLEVRVGVKLMKKGIKFAKAFGPNKVLEYQHRNIREILY